MARVDNLRRMRAFRRGFSRRHIALGIDKRPMLRPERKRATLTTALAGTNNDVLVSAYYYGSEGNAIRFGIVVPGTANAVASVTVSGNDITFNSATTGVAGTPASTATQMMNAVNADAVAGKKVFLQLAAGNDGTGVIAALALTSLTGGQ